MNTLKMLDRQYCLNKISEYSKDPKYKDDLGKVKIIQFDNSLMFLWEYQMLFDEGAISNKRLIADSCFVRVFKSDDTTIEVVNCLSYEVENVIYDLKVVYKNHQVEVKWWPMKFYSFKKVMNENV